MNYDKMDKIILNPEEVDILEDWYNDNIGKLKTISFPLKEGVIELTDGITHPTGNNTLLFYFKVNEEERIILFQHWLKDGMEKMTSFIIGEDYGKTNEILSIEGYGGFTRISREQLEEICETHLFLAFGVFQFMTENVKRISEVEEKKTIKKKGKSKKSSKNSKSRFTKITATRYIFDLSGEKSKEYERHTESWSVRGHWRNFKDGRKVWVKPYIKGSSPDTVEAKNYKF